MSEQIDEAPCFDDALVGPRDDVTSPVISAKPRRVKSEYSVAYNLLEIIPKRLKLLDQNVGFLCSLLAEIKKIIYQKILYDE
jgi:hypothetical protein